MAEATPGGIAFDTTAPVTQASADVAAVGVAAAAARRDHRHGIPTLAAAPGITYAGGNTTEATTTSTTAVDLLSVASLSIAAATPFQFVISCRKTTGAAAFADFGLKLNTTVVGEAVATNNAVLDTAGGNLAEFGVSVILIGPRVAPYVRGGSGFWSGTSTVSESANIAQPTQSANVPTANITDVVIRALVGSALITAGADELQVYTLATS
jgi:hypothetical protein